MVKTLFKYEFKAYARTLLPLQAILVVLATLVRGVQFLESDTVAYDIVFISSVVMLVISMVVLLVFSMIFSITRFYKNLFSHEGYLSFTLPVTTDQHLLTKLVMAFAFTLISVVSVIISGMVATSGDMLVEIIKVIGYGFSQLFELTDGHSLPLMFEFILAALLSIINSYLIFYACISIGQTARKNRILAAFGVYFGYYLITQTISTIGILIINALYYTELWNKFTTWIDWHPYAFAHSFMGVVITVSLVLGFVYYIISRKIITNRLNLE